jgi:hypothetical protein
MSKVQLIPVLILSAVFSSSSPALAGGKWVREGDTEIVPGLTRGTKAVALMADTEADFGYGLVAYVPSGKPNKKLRLGEIKTLSTSYVVMNGVTAGGSPRMSIIVDVNRDGTVLDEFGNFDFDNDEIVFVSLGSDPLGHEETGDVIISGNLCKSTTRFTTASGSVTLGSWQDILDSEVNGHLLSGGAVDAVFTIVDYQGDEQPLVVGVTAMQVNSAKLNARAKIPSTN